MARSLITKSIGKRERNIFLLISLTFGYGAQKNRLFLLKPMITYFAFAHWSQMVRLNSKKHLPNAKRCILTEETRTFNILLYRK